MNQPAEAFNNAEKQLPPRVGFYMDLERLHRDFSGQIADAIAQTENPEAYSDKDEIMVAFGEKKKPLQIGEADSAEFSSLWSSRQTYEKLPFTVLSLRLFSDNSPYAMTEDYEQGIEDNLYRIYAAAEMPPFIVNDSILDKFYIKGKSDELGRYLESIQQKGGQPRYLTDMECASIIGALNDNPLDTKYALQANLID